MIRRALKKIWEFLQAPYVSQGGQKEGIAVFDLDNSLLPCQRYHPLYYFAVNCLPGYLLTF